MAQPALKEWTETTNPSPVHKINKQKRLAKKVTLVGKDFIYLAAVVIIAFAVTTSIVKSTVALTNAQHELQTIRKQQTKLQVQNTNAKQEISELSSWSRLSKIAASAGLKLNESSTRNVTK